MNYKLLFYMFCYNNCLDRRGRDRVVVGFRVVSTWRSVLDIKIAIQCLLSKFHQAMSVNIHYLTGRHLLDITSLERHWHTDTFCIHPIST